MKYPSTLIQLVAATLFCAAATFAQTPGDLKHFDKDGLVFDYQNGWTLVDNSTAKEQNMVLARNDSDAQIRVYAHRGRVDTPERLTQARSKIVDPYLDSLAKNFEQTGGKPVRETAETEIGGMKAEGVRIRVIDNDPGEAGVYWLVLNERIVVLTFFGPDGALKKAAPDWDAVRNSLRIIGDSKPATKTTPK